MFYFPVDQWSPLATIVPLSCILFILASNKEPIISRRPSHYKFNNFSRKNLPVKRMVFTVFYLTVIVWELKACLGAFNRHLAKMLTFTT